MHISQSSRTAEAMALFRTLETRCGPSALFSDEIGSRFLSPALNAVAAASAIPGLREGIAAVLDRRWPGARSSGIARTRYIDDQLVSALREPKAQMVILGAGFDTRAYRLPELAKIEVFEVDHPNTSIAKRRILAGLKSAHGNIRHVSVDFARDDLKEALTEAECDIRRPTLFLWEGVSQYLNAQAVSDTLKFVGSASRGSEIIFTYVDVEALSKNAPFDGMSAVNKTVSSMSEPWIFGLRPSEVPTYLEEHGLHFLSDLGASDYRALYKKFQRSTIRGYEFYHVVRAVVL